MSAGAKPGERRGGKPKGYQAPHTLKAQESKKALIDRYQSEQAEIDGALINKAKTGDVPAIKEVYDRVYGKSKDSLDVTSGGESLSAILGITIHSPK